MDLYKEGKMYGRDLSYSPIYPSPLLCFIFPIRKVSTRPFTTRPHQAGRKRSSWPAGLWGALRTIDFLPKVRGKHESSIMDKDLPYYRVAHLLRRVRNRRESYLSAGDLERLGIKLSGIDIETGRLADSGLQFCGSYPSREFDNVFEKVSAGLRLGG